MRLAGILTVICCSAPLPALAQELPLTFRSSPGCGTKAEFEARLIERLPQAAQGTLPRGERLEVSLDGGADGVDARLLVIDGQGRTSRRQISAATCAEALDGLALIAALALQHEDSASGAPPPRPSPPAAPPPPVPSPPQAGPGLGFDLATSGMVATGALPEPMPVLELGVGLRLPATGKRALVRLSFRVSPHQSSAIAAGTATFDWWSGALVLCPRNFALSSGVSLDPYLVAELGRLEASGSGTLNPRSEARTWLAPGLGAMLRAAVLPPLSLELAAEAVLPLIRDRFLFGEAPVHEVAPLGARARLGLAVGFE